MIEDWVYEAARHAEVCTQPPTCPGRHPGYDDCTVAELAVAHIKLHKRAENLWMALVFIKNHGSHDQAVLRKVATNAVEEDK